MQRSLTKTITVSALIWHAGVYDYLSGDVLTLLNCLPKRSAATAKITERDIGNGTVYATVYYLDRADWDKEQCDALPIACKIRCPIEEDESQK